MMKAFVKETATENKLARTEVPIPEVDANELLVRVLAIGVGIHDGYFYPANAHYPYVIGIEAAGVIEKVGREVVDYKVGERITFVSSMQAKGGTWAEYAVVRDDSLILRIPEQMRFEEAAAIPVAGNTALKIFHALNLKAGDPLFVAGASGAVGTFVIQLAAARGYRVVASASEKNHAYMQALGAEKTVDYHDADWPEQIKQWQPGGVEAAIAIPRNTAQASMAVVKDGGIVVTVSGEQFRPERGISLKQIPYQADVKAELTEMIHKIDRGEMQLTIEKVYPFEEGLAALQKTQSGHARGKLVLTMA